MPIDRSRYPQNWEEIARRTKRSANWHCQHCGNACLLPGEDWLEFMLRSYWSVAEAIAHHQKPVRFVLTTAHLDQEPANCAPSNLAALCSVCHLKYDRPFRQYNRQRKLERKGQGNLFYLVEPAPAGHGLDPSRIQLPLEIRHG